MKVDEGGGGSPAGTFSVELPALTKLVAALEELEGHAAAARSYSSYADVHSSGGGLMVKLADATIHVSDDLERMFHRLGQITGRGAQEIRNTRELYRTLDEESAQRIDSTYWSA